MNSVSVRSITRVRSSASSAALLRAPANWGAVAASTSPRARTTTLSDDSSSVSDRWVAGIIDTHNAGGGRRFSGEDRPALRAGSMHVRVGQGRPHRAPLASFALAVGVDRTPAAEPAGMIGVAGDDRAEDPVPEDPQPSRVHRAPARVTQTRTAHGAEAARARALLDGHDRAVVRGARSSREANQLSAAGSAVAQEEAHPLANQHGDGRAEETSDMHAIAGVQPWLAREGEVSARAGGRRRDVGDNARERVGRTVEMHGPTGLVVAGQSPREHRPTAEDDRVRLRAKAQLRLGSGSPLVTGLVGGLGYAGEDDGDRERARDKEDAVQAGPFWWCAGVQACGLLPLVRTLLEPQGFGLSPA